MREWFSSNKQSPQRPERHKAGLILLSATFTAGIAWLAPDAAMGQATLPGMQPSPGMGVTSPLALRSTRPQSIPLGSTEIATRGLSSPDPSAATANCSGSGNTGSPGALFDGGGLSGSAPLSCADRETPSSALPPTSVRPTGLPLGATELGSAGLSTAAPVPGSLPGGSGSTSAGNP